MKRLLYLCTGIIISISVFLFGITVNAEERRFPSGEESGEIIVHEDPDAVLQEGGKDLPELQYCHQNALGALSYDATYSALEKRLTEAWKKLDYDWIDITDIGISFDDISEYYYSILNDHPEFFYVKNKHEFMSVNKNLYIGANYISSDKAEVSKMIADYDQALEDFLSNVNDNWSDLEKITFINDYITKLCQYDQSQSLTNSHNAYGVLVDNIAVCEGYALGFNQLAGLLGIKSYLVTSNKMNHAWNMVQLNGKYYMVDVTYNDPGTSFTKLDTLGLSEHEYLLKSYEWFNSSDGRHTADDYNVRGLVSYTLADDTYYDSYFWNNNHCGFEYIHGAWYSFDGSGISEYTCDGTDWKLQNQVLDLSSKLVVEFSAAILGSSEVLITSHSNEIIYNLPYQVEAYNVITKTTRTLYEIDSSEIPGKQVYGVLRTSDDEIICRVSNSAIASGDLITINLYESPASGLPEVTIKNGNNSWTSFPNSGRTYTTNKQVTIEVGIGDFTSGYYMSKNKASRAKLSGFTDSDWLPIPSGGIELKTTGSYNIYVRVMDSAGNYKYVGTNVIRADYDKPVITAGNGSGTYYDKVTVTIEDDNPGKVYVDGTEVAMELNTIEITATDTEKRTITAYDLAGNQSSLEIKLLKKQDQQQNQNQEEDLYSKYPDPYSVVRVIDNIKYKLTKTTSGDIGVMVCGHKNKNVTKVTIPDEIYVLGFRYRVSAIDDKAFSGYKKLKTVTIGYSVEKIGDKAFYKCTSLKKIVLPTYIRTIGSQAFYGCKKLKSVTIQSKRLKSGKIGKKAFSNINKKAVFYVPKSKYKLYKKLIKKAKAPSKCKIKKVK